MMRGCQFVPTVCELEQGRVADYGTDKAALIRDHCKFSSQMEWKNAIKLI